MADDLKSVSVKNRVSAEEWKVRVDLAALYRLVALYGWDDLIFTHISARVPGPEHHFLINPYGFFFEEITASSLVKVDLDGNIVEPTEYFVNPAGFTIHSAIHAAREDAKFVLHVHTDQGVAVSATKEGLLPISQQALTVIPRLAYHDYEGIALDLGERERLVKDLGTKQVMMLWNHGTLAVGETASQCWLGIYNLERACEIQVLASSQGREHLKIAPVAAQETVKQQVEAAMGMGALLAWPGCLRKLDRQSPGYDS
ncbi:MAG: class II aldolase/adducin family protein [Hyphomonadaceae bacterium]|nr:class II aldolase/adducin family protein [Hyphomonadaceae bacterium]